MILQTHSIHFEFLPKTMDVWVRDFMPIQIGDNNFVQFDLHKEYYPKKDQHLRTDPAPICKHLGISPSIPKYNGKPIFLDGGNVIRGYGKAIICDKVLRDNSIPKNILIDLLTEVLKVDRVILVPQDPEDTCGHADGMIRLLDENTVLVNDFTYANSGKNYRDEFYQVLGDEELDVIRVPNCPVDSKAYIQPAMVCYINFLQVGKMVFLPTFTDLRNDERALGMFIDIFGRENVVTVPSLAIAKLGGVLNCLSWEM